MNIFMLIIKELFGKFCSYGHKFPKPKLMNYPTLNMINKIIAVCPLNSLGVNSRTVRGANVLQEEINALRKLAYKLLPFLPQTAEKILKQFTGEIKSQPALFPRI